VIEWRAGVRALAVLGNDAEFPLLVFRASPPTGTSWPTELAQPSEGVWEFYRLCDGGYFGGHHRLLSVAELVPENRRWWQMLAETPGSVGGALEANRHVVLGCDECGFPLVWDQRTDCLARFDYRDTGELLPLNQTLEQFMAAMFQESYPDDMWQEALRQLQAKVK